MDKPTRGPPELPRLTNSALGLLGVVRRAHVRGFRADLGYCCALSLCAPNVHAEIPPLKGCSVSSRAFAGGVGPEGGEP